MKAQLAILFLLSLSSVSFALFKPYPNVYNEKDAIEFVHIASMNYCPINQIVEWNCGMNCDALPDYDYYFVVEVAVSADETFSFSQLVNKKTKRLVTSFRGTKGLTELGVEILSSIVPVPYTIHDIEGGWVDNYFQQRYVGMLQALVIQQTQQAVAEFPDYLFVFTGHSLGAALATLAAHDMILSGYVPKNQVIMYNFGSPRIFNYPVAQSVQETIPVYFRVTRYKDVFVHLPPCATNWWLECVSGSPSENPTFVNYGWQALELATSVLNDPESIVASLSADEDLKWNPFWKPWHIDNQIFYNTENTLSYVSCVGAEDPTCSDRFNVLDCNINDHLSYLGVIMGQCAILDKNTSKN